MTQSASAAKRQHYIGRPPSFTREQLEAVRALLGQSATRLIEA